jgi:endonuclease YncB( thermonuclease family)
MKNKVTYLFLFSIVLFNISCNSNNGERKLNEPNKQNEKGKIIGVIDGDTYDILIEGNKTLRVRMEGIDAPEKGMPFYRVAKDYLSNMCFKKQVTIKITGKDYYNRILAYSYLEDGRELSHEMLKAGLAWHFIKYNSDADLQQLEIEAKKQKIGIWQNDNPMPPWKNRMLHRNRISTKDSFNIKPGEH